MTVDGSRSPHPPSGPGSCSWVRACWSSKPRSCLKKAFVQSPRYAGKVRDRDQPRIEVEGSGGALRQKRPGSSKCRGSHIGGSQLVQGVAQFARLRGAVSGGCGRYTFARADPRRVLGAGLGPKYTDRGAGAGNLRRQLLQGLLVAEWSRDAVRSP